MDRASVISIILHFSPLGCICKTKNHNFAGLTGLPSQQKCLQLSLPLSQFQHCKIIGIIGRPPKQLVLSLLHSWELYALTCLRATHPQRPHTSAAAIQKAQKTYGLKQNPWSTEHVCINVMCGKSTVDYCNNAMDLPCSLLVSTPLF